MGYSKSSNDSPAESNCSGRGEESLHIRKPKWVSRGTTFLFTCHLKWMPELFYDTWLSSDPVQKPLAGSRLLSLSGCCQTVTAPASRKSQTEGVLFKKLVHRRQDRPPVEKNTKTYLLLFTTLSSAHPRMTSLVCQSRMLAYCCPWLGEMGMPLCTEFLAWTKALVVSKEVQLTW